MKKDDKKPIYILCPRCELNYIQKKDKYCEVCKAELGLSDRSFLIPDEYESAGVSDEKLCPICHVNFVEEGEETCFMCAKAHNEKSAPEDDDSWMTYEDRQERVTEDGVESLEMLAEDEEEEEEENERKDGKAYREPDDFNYEIDPRDFEEEDEDFEDDDFEEDEEEDDL